jgi:hypothetical protein
VARARQCIRSTGWETVEYRVLGTLDTVRQRLENDSVTGTRKDFTANIDAPDVALLQLEETVSSARSCCWRWRPACSGSAR